MSPDRSEISSALAGRMSVPGIDMISSPVHSALCSQFVFNSGKNTCRFAASPRWILDGGSVAASRHNHIISIQRRQSVERQKAETTPTPNHAWRSKGNYGFSSRVD